MSRSRSSASAPVDAELRLPRPPGVIRQFWARHPLVTDILIALVCLFLSIAPTTTFQTSVGSTAGSAVATTPVLLAPLPILVVVACALLLRRRQWPVIALTASYVVAASYLFVSAPVGGPLLLVTAYSVAVYRSVRLCWIAFGVGLGALTVVAFTLSSIGAVPLSNTLNTVVGSLVLGLIGALVGINVGNRRRYMEAVIDRSRQLLVERDQQAQLAAAAERERIAREMHDIVSHSLTVVVALAEGAMATDDRERARGAMDAAAYTAREALTEMRAMLGVLRTDGEAPLTPLSPADPHDTVVAAQRAGFPVSIAMAGRADAPTAVQHAVGRIVQEGVTNAMRHASTASEIRVRVDYGADRVAIEIANDGVVSGDRGSGFGLRGLAERVSHVGGTVRSGPVGRERWLLAAILPYDANRVVAAEAARA